MDIVKHVNKILAEATGIEGLTSRDLDANSAADQMLYTLAQQFAQKEADIRRHADAILRDMQRAIERRQYETLASSSSSRQHDDAVSALNALREPLGTAAYYFKLARGLVKAA